jgi:hypothetical protein
VAEHPDYLAADERHRWGAPLNQLFGALRKEAWALEGQWAWKILPHGALVAVQIVPPSEGVTAFSTRLRIARRTLPADEKGWKAWAQELAVFLKHLGGQDGDWARLEGDPAKAEAIYQFQMRGRAVPKCVRCGGEAIDPGKFKEDLCNRCATWKRASNGSWP